MGSLKWNYNWGFSDIPEFIVALKNIFTWQILKISNTLTLNFTSKKFSSIVRVTFVCISCLVTTLLLLSLVLIGGLICIFLWFFYFLIKYWKCIEIRILHKITTNPHKTKQLNWKIMETTKQTQMKLKIKQNLPKATMKKWNLKNQNQVKKSIFW